MMIWIQLTDHEGDPLWLNADAAMLMLQKKDEATDVVMTRIGLGHDDMVVVRETPDEIIQLIKDEEMAAP